MKFHFVIPDTNHPFWFPMGPAYISSVLKRNGHSISLTDFTLNPKKSDEEMLSEIVDINPDYILVPILSIHSLDQAMRISDLIYRETSKPIIFGGIASTQMHELLLIKDYTFAVVLGEAEGALSEFADDPDKRTTGNIIFRSKTGEIKRNDLKNLNNSLDDLPFPDRDLFAQYIQNNFNATWMLIMTGRGCPYNCPYCFNDQYKEMYKGKGSYLRFRSAENVMEELLLLKEKYPIEYIWFVDDVLAINTELMKNLGQLYFKNSFGINASMNVRIDLINDRLIDLMKSININDVRFGIESGDEKFRKEVLGRNISDKQIIDNHKLLKKHGFTTKTYNILGFPTETYEQCISTIRINEQLNPDKVEFSIFHPYPMTALYDQAKRNGQLVDDIGFGKNFYFIPKLNRLISDKQLQEIFDMAYNKFHFTTY